jgi:probable F420-dependent oxidoreductase
MRFTFAESMTDPSYYLPLARACDEAGWDGFVVPDSICYPRDSDATYPYTPDGRREFLEDKPFLEPFSVIPAMGAVTERLRFTTFVVKLPIRQPVLVAKQASSVAVLTDNRFGFGVGLSPWPEDYVVTGTTWARRGRRMDEMIEIVIGLTRTPPGQYFAYEGEFYDVPAVKLCPLPTEPLPVLVGGHADAALRRAARLCDGWMHAGSEMDRLPAMIDRLHELRREYGRDGRPFEIHVISLDGYSVDGCRRLEDLGVTDVIVGFRNAYQMEQDTEPLRQKVDALRRFADDVIAKVKG